MKGSSIKIIIYIVLIGLGWYIYKLNHGGVIRETYFEPLYRSLHTSGSSISKTLLLAHRGSRYLLPENTMLAFQTALDLGTDVIETDVRLSKDGHIVMFHDKLLDRTTNIVGEVEEHTLAQLQACDAGYRFTPDNGTTYPFRGRGIKIPTCRQMFDGLSLTAPLNIEIKENDVKVADGLWKELERAFENGRHHRSVVVSCRYCEPTAHIRKLALAYQQRKGLEELPLTTSGCEKEVTRFVILSQLYLAKVWYSWFPITSFEVFQVPLVSGPISLENDRFIGAAHFFGKHVHFWVINNASEIARVLTLGIEGIISDRPDLGARVFKDKGIKPATLHIPKPLPSNHTGTYFIPSVDIEETHTCITLFCILLQRVHLIIIALVITFVFFKIFAARGVIKMANNKSIHQQQQTTLNSTPKKNTIKKKSH